MFCSCFLPKQAATIYLRPCGRLPHPSFQAWKFPYQIWVSRLWGLPRSTLNVSKETPSLWHFQERFHSLRLRINSAVSFLPEFIFSFSIITTIITDGASMDFPLHIKYAAFTQIYYCCSLPNMIFSSCDILLNKSTLVISFSPILAASILDFKFLTSFFKTVFS